MKIVTLGVLCLLVFRADLGISKSFERAVFPSKAFWEKKERIYKRMSEDRAIFVSVKTEDVKGTPPKQLNILGAGIISRPRSQAFSRLSNYSKWSEIHEVIRVSRWTPATGRLFLHMEAFDYHAKMILQVEVEKSKDADFIHMKVVKGSFLGMRVAFRFKDAKSRRTEVAMAAQYDFATLPMPLFFVEFGLEVVFQKIAGKMRLFVEKE